MSKIERFKNDVKERFEEAPEYFIAVAASTIYLAAKTIDVLASAKSKRAYARHMNRTSR